MKTFLQMLTGMAMLCLSLTSNAQYVENFSTTPIGGLPSGWTVAANTDVAVYQRPGSCTVNDQGLQTPGVGKTAPTGVLLPSTTYSVANNDIVIQFSIYVYDANMKCSNAKPFDCPTYVKAYLVPTSWSDPLATPTAAQYYVAQPNYQILNPNASNTIVFADASLPAGITSYRVLLNFKTADGSSCTTGNTKFVLDDFNVNGSNCSNCAPVANADYFNADAQSLFSSSTSFKANVYGGYAMWETQAPSGYGISSLTTAPAVSNGTDKDLNNTSLNNAVFSQASSLVVESSSGCADGTANAGTLTFHQDGTFSYTKGSACVSRVSFTYTLTTYSGSNHKNAYGTTAPTKVTIDLPGQVVGLPVRFQSFTATRQGKQVLLQWATAMEQHNKGFYLQRNTDGTWKDIGLVFSATEDGNSTIERNYTFNDLNPYSGLTQYRILQVDLDGRGHYSETRAVRGEAAGSKLTLFPNPTTTGNVMMLFESAGSKEVTVADMAGRVVQRYTKVMGSSLEIKNLRNGFYTVLVHDSNTGATSAEKVIVK